MDLISNGLLPLRPLENEIPLAILGNHNALYCDSLSIIVDKITHIKNQFKIYNTNFYHKFGYNDDGTSYNNNSKFTLETYNYLTGKHLLNFECSQGNKISMAKGLDRFCCNLFENKIYSFVSMKKTYAVIEGMLWVKDVLEVWHLIGAITINKKYITRYRTNIVKAKLLNNKWFTIFIANSIKETKIEKELLKNPLFSVLNTVYTDSILTQLYPSQCQLTQEHKDTILKELSLINLER